MTFSFPEFISAAILGESKWPRQQRLQRQQTTLKLVQFLSGRRKGNGALWGQTTASGIKACSMRMCFDVLLLSSRLHVCYVVGCSIKKSLFRDII